MYANFGTVKDFEQLKDMGVSVKNKIVIIRQGRVFRGNKVINLVIMTTTTTTTTTTNNNNNNNNDNNNSNSNNNIICRSI